ncbi:MAG TPA: hypothetical protein VNK52_12580 [Hyphomicrobiaceae bacterium]|nr:hypothetical protein [Hyphomicrobiaceae bacterium]
MWHRRAGPVLALVVMVSWVARAAAVPLDPEACDRLEQEQAELIRAGARQNMAKGPAWAVGNLSPDKLAAIRRLLEVDAQLAFRCLEPKAAKAATNAKEAPKSAAAPAASVEVPIPVPKPKTPKAAASPSRAKVNDAYVPPPKIEEPPWSVPAAGQQ